MANFDDLQGAVAQFGANNKVIFDDTGMPSIMVAVPKAKYSDVITGGTDETLPFWIMDGEEKSVIYVSILCGNALYRQFKRYGKGKCKLFQRCGA